MVFLGTRLEDFFGKSYIESNLEVLFLFNINNSALEFRCLRAS